MDVNYISIKGFGCAPGLIEHMGDVRDLRSVVDGGGTGTFFDSTVGTSALARNFTHVIEFDRSCMRH